MSSRPAPPQLAMPASTSFAVSVSSFDLRGRLRRLDLAARLGERASADARVEVIGRLDQRGGRQVPRNRQHAVLDAAVLGDEDGEHALSLEPHEVDLLQAHVGLVDRDDAGRAGETREQPRRLGEHAFEVALLGGGLDLRLDARALLRPDVADLQQRIDEEAQAELGRQPPRADMGRVDEAELLQILHDVAHRGGRERHRQDPRNMARADRLARGEKAVDDLPENLARALVELGEIGGGGRRRGHAPSIAQGSAGANSTKVERRARVGHKIPSSRG